VEAAKTMVPDPVAHEGDLLWTIPNVLTVIRIILTPVYLLLLFSELWYARVSGCVVFGLAALTDLYDGRIARRAGTTTEFGRFMDPLADKLLVSSALVAFVMMQLVHAWLVIVTLVRDVAITLLRTLLIRKGHPLETSFFAKIKTMLQLVVVSCIMLALAVQGTLLEYGVEVYTLTGAWEATLVNGAVGVVTVLAVVSGLQYLVAAWRATA
tara:strand:- start:1358 stop:1990 length:633 start_codon:yes stop_codon:yes gene_type:complete